VTRAKGTVNQLRRRARAWLAALFGLCVATPATAGDASPQRILYVADDSGLSLYDIDRGHAFLRRIEVPGASDYKGVGASPQLGRLFLSSREANELLSIDLRSEAVVARQRYGDYPDSFAVTPDGRRLFLPCRGDPDWAWWVIDAQTGETITRIATPRGKAYPRDPAQVPPRTRSAGPHNTWINPDGTRAYLGSFTVPYVTIVDTRTHEILGRVGPFSDGVRPFTVTRDEQYVIANVDGLLGFEVAQARSEAGWGGPLLHRVEAHTPSERVARLGKPAKLPHNTPSHGVNLRPDGREVWVVDGYYGYVYVYDVTAMPPAFVQAVPLFERPDDTPHPGWISFSLDGRFAYPDHGPVLDTETKRVVARIPLSEKVLEVRYRDGVPVEAGHR